MLIIRKKLSNVALGLPEIMVPAKNVDLSKWSVIACDQYTSDEGYWKKVEDYVGSSPSTLKLILPEVYLDTAKDKKGVSSIIREMKSYLRFNVLKKLEPGFIYTRRTTGYGNVRNGLMVMVDLENYDFFEGAETLIRPTERTIIERIPPRVKIREKAPVELPHILFLIDDPGKTVIEPLEKTKNLYKKLYDFDLMAEGGHIEGYHITERKALSSIANALAELADKTAFSKQYGDKPVMLYAVGDGNHSLASAKQHWDNIKEENGLASDSDHPARFALVELVNIHEEGLKFEPIHRILFDCPLEDVLGSIESEFDAGVREFDDTSSLLELVEKEYANKESHTYGLVSGDLKVAVTIRNPDHNLAVATMQSFLDRFLAGRDTEIDFTHGADDTIALAKKGDTAVLLPPIDKEGFFRTVIEEGTLPRKAFSMGHADEKRFYLEARRIDG